MEGARPLYPATTDMNALEEGDEHISVTSTRGTRSPRRHHDRRRTRAPRPEPKTQERRNEDKGARTETNRRSAKRRRMTNSDRDRTRKPDSPRRRDQDRGRRTSRHTTHAHDKPDTRNKPTITFAERSHEHQEKFVVRSPLESARWTETPRFIHPAHTRSMDTQRTRPIAPHPWHSQTPYAPLSSVRTPSLPIAAGHGHLSGFPNSATTILGPTYSPPAMFYRQITTQFLDATYRATESLIFPDRYTTESLQTFDHACMTQPFRARHVLFVDGDHGDSSLLLFSPFLRTAEARFLSAARAFLFSLGRLAQAIAISNVLYADTSDDHYLRTLVSQGDLEGPDRWRLTPAYEADLEQRTRQVVRMGRI